MVSPFGFGEDCRLYGTHLQRLHQPWRLVAVGVRTVCRRDFPRTRLCRPVAGTVPQGCGTFGIPGPLSLDRTGGLLRETRLRLHRRRIRPGRRGDTNLSFRHTCLRPARLRRIRRPARTARRGGGTLPPRPDGFRNSDGQRRDGTGFRRPAAQQPGLHSGTRPCGDLQGEARRTRHVHPDTGGTPRRPALRGAARRTALRTRRPPRHRPGRGTARRGHAAGPRHGIRRSIPMRQSRLLPPLRLPFHSPLRYPAHRRHSTAIRNGRRAPSPGTARHNRHRLLLLTAPLHPIAAPAPIHSDTHHCGKAGPVHVSLRESPTTRDRPPSRDRPVLPPSRHNRCRSHHTPPRCRL